jgi:hypothetical protein
VLPIDDIVAAHRRVDSGRKVGNIVLRPQERAAAPDLAGTEQQRSA